MACPNQLSYFSQFKFGAVFTVLLMGTGAMHAQQKYKNKEKKAVRD
jgi:hypothetical protein